MIFLFYGKAYPSDGSLAPPHSHYCNRFYQFLFCGTCCSSSSLFFQVTSSSCCDNGVNADRLYKMKEIYLLPILILILSVVKSWSFCVEAGKSTIFARPPRISQIHLHKVNVSWDGIVRNSECADGFFVQFWNNLNEIKSTEEVEPGRTFIEVDVVPDLKYSYRVIAREESAGTKDAVWRQSPIFSFTTSSNPQETSTEFVIPEEVTAAGNNFNFLDVRWEYLTLIIVGLIVVAMVIMGVLCKVVKRRDRPNFDDEEGSQASNRSSQGAEATPLQD